MSLDRCYQCDAHYKPESPHGACPECGFVYPLWPFRPEASP
jgi:hypothetical protein